MNFRAITLSALFAAAAMQCFAGGPIVVGGTGFGVNGQPFVWDVAAGPITYRVDGGPMAKRNGIAMISNATGASRVQQMFQVWEDVPTSNVAFRRDTGNITADGDVSTAAELDALLGACENATATQTPIVFDADGSIFRELNVPSDVIGFAGACSITSTGRINSGFAIMNGIFQDSVFDFLADNFEMSAAHFDQAFTHEFGHLIGMDHSQINGDVLERPDIFPCDADTTSGLPLMFPIIWCESRVSRGFPVLAADDAAWVSKLYPSPSFATTYGILRGRIRFSDGITQAQGVNVIARRWNDPATPQDESRREAYSVVSGFLFTINPGQSLTGTNTGGSDFGSKAGGNVGYYEIPVLPGIYTLEVEPVDQGFFDGSGVGPVNPPFPNPGSNEFFGGTPSESSSDDAREATLITVGAGETKEQDIILNGTLPRFDVHEDEASVPSSAPILAAAYRPRYGAQEVRR